VTEGAAIQELNARMRARSGEIEAALLSELPASLDLAPGIETELLAGLRAGARDGVVYSLAAFEGGTDWEEPLPGSMVEQARWAAQVGLPLEDLLRGYSAANTTISRFVAEECAGLPAEALSHAIDVQARVAEALIGGFTASYVQEAALVEAGSARRGLARQVEAILDDGLPSPDFPYGLDRWHVAGILVGPAAEQTAGLLAEHLGCGLLLVPRAAEMHWAWWGGDRRISLERFETAASPVGEGASLAFGESLEGVDGFRRSHRQASFGIEVTVRTRRRLVRGADAVLLGTLLRDAALAAVFVDAQLGRLSSLPDWPKLRQTLIAYIDCDAVLATAAVALGVDRQTVKRRLERIEGVTERPLHSHRAQLELALQIEAVGSAAPLR
jgi:hypothetical protein